MIKLNEKALLDCMGKLLHLKSVIIQLIYDSLNSKTLMKQKNYLTAKL